MPNDMMIAALNSQRQGNVDPSPNADSTDKPVGIEERLSALEEKYEELCKLVGVDEKEAPKDVARGY